MISRNKRHFFISVIAINVFYCIVIICMHGSKVSSVATVAIDGRWRMMLQSLLYPPQTKLQGYIVILMSVRLFVRSFVRPSVRPSQSLIRYSSKTAEQNFMKLSGIVHYMMPYCTSYFKFLFEWFWGFPEQNKDFAIQNMGERGGIILWALLTVFLGFFYQLIVNNF